VILDTKAHASATDKLVASDGGGVRHYIESYVLRVVLGQMKKWQKQPLNEQYSWYPFLRLPRPFNLVNIVLSLRRTLGHFDAIPLDKRAERPLKIKEITLKHSGKVIAPSSL
jgi:hypothetical protein